jgi:hypothetical protein
MIDVRVMDAEGNLKRKVSIEDESGTLRGAITGAICGAVLGTVVAVFALFGGLGPATTETGGVRALGGAIGVALSLAAAGVPLGAFVGLVFWKGRMKVSQREVREGSVVVVVKSEELAETARGVLEDAGAVRVEIRDGSRSPAR